MSLGRERMACSPPPVRSLRTFDTTCYRERSRSRFHACNGLVGDSHGKCPAMVATLGLMRPLRCRVM